MFYQMYHFTFIERTGHQWINWKLAYHGQENQIEEKFKNKLLSLANGKYKKQQLHFLYPILQLLAFNIVLSFAS